MAMTATRLITAAGHRVRAAPAGAYERADATADWGRVMAKIGYARVSTRSQNDDS
jgi:hypothetical protein